MLPPDKDKDQKDNHEIYRQDQARQVSIRGSVNIGGNLGPNVIIGDGGMQSINIAGGESTGDVYKVINQNEAQDLDQIQKMIDLQPVQDNQKTDLREAVHAIRQEIGLGIQADPSKIAWLLREVQAISPLIRRTLADWIVANPNLPVSILMVAKETYSWP
jgi:hypothetical protein